MLGVGEAEGGLQVVQGPVVVTEQDEDIAEGAMNLGHGGVTQGER